ncbi:MAG: hypothetical protein ACREHD_21910 [Pirellulales bacterium]
MASKSELKSEAISAVRSLDKDAVIRALDELRAFQTNWDGYGAAPLDPRNLDAVQRFIESLPDGAAPTPKVVPMTRGRVQLEWHRGNRSLELEFENPATVHYLQWDSDQGIETEDVVSSERAEVLTGLLSWFSAE